MNFEKTTLFLTVKDYSVSQEVFELYYNEEYDMLVTHPQPSLTQLPRYYEDSNYISHTDANTTLFEKVYQIVKKRAVKKKVTLINKLSKKGKLLDIGAGVGDFLYAAKEQGWETLGYEPNDNARKIASSKGVAFTNETKNLESNSFDVITMWHVLEHVPDLEWQLDELRRLLKPGGIVLVAVPNYKSFDAKYYKNFWAAYDVPIHFWHFSRTSIIKLFSQNNFTLIKTIPMLYDSFYVSLLSEKYKRGKMNFIKAFYIGLVSNSKGMINKEFSSHIYVLKKGK
ncbi:class I SAM-dependent methyltransferase [Flavobacterium aciduliphilum]|uniref:2-polyprenyl-3-methyl-5-hydroxy-6-metoxy-1, 4-benzoquinol methylase n=1 Tax=Flavobacterium aciduliphilum TaxID=1101402 RepID=A0A328YFT4_9FLAO|nr:class I SAM-dependent methyltransferase [Flavobacterium aciduliphilum]RAR72871.1 2-polyprenyl-3-methyl-5-hydroxy-6-metoxy-1,4-benzoquinol methylase [Flavobacterium aciduliphilum]